MSTRIIDEVDQFNMPTWTLYKTRDHAGFEVNQCINCQAGPPAHADADGACLFSPGTKYEPAHGIVVGDSGPPFSWFTGDGA